MKRATWAACWLWSQLTAMLASIVLWLMAGAVWPVLWLVGLVYGVVLVAGRHSRAGLAWRFGVRPASEFEKRMVLKGIVPIAQLRGRRQPRVWVSQRPQISVVMPTRSDLVIGPSLITGVVMGQRPAEELSALVSHALGQEPVRSSLLVAVVDVCCTPWRVIEVVIAKLAPVVGRIPLAGLAWRVRWVVFAVAVVGAAQQGRWVGVAGAALLAVLTWSTGFFNRRWMSRWMKLGDDQVCADGLGGALATMIRRRSTALADLERADALNRGAGKVTEAPGC